MTVTFAHNCNALTWMGGLFKKVTNRLVHTNVLVFCDTDKPNPLYCVPYL